MHGRRGCSRLLMLEARDACSGPTARNGEHITPPLYHNYLQGYSRRTLHSDCTQCTTHSLSLHPHPVGISTPNMLFILPMNGRPISSRGCGKKIGPRTRPYDCTAASIADGSVHCCLCYNQG
ncbi:hypothetical protein EV421DRAFT_1755889 [Armillaria borealis]|uniref:Uncharacterized protein n=1 Tax=Armillaria borealis TaxID=47425 RepID=A0AA39N4J3_9AGAR|nr:hypothetical protein EV421DRAFT_1755889 [Armillaria borealis]